MSSKLQTLEPLIASAVAAVGYELVGVEYLAQGRHSLLRIYIDSAHGITVDDCEKASRQISAMLEVDEPLTETYTLEVSSPGLERPFFSLEQMIPFIGQSIKIRLYLPYQGQRNFKGLLVNIIADSLVIEVNGQPITFAFVEVEKANLVAEI